MAFKEVVENFAAKIKDIIDEEVLDEVRAEVWTPPEHNIEPADLPTFVPESYGHNELGTSQMQQTCSHRFEMPILRRTHPSLFTEDIIGVDPATSPTSPIFSIHRDATDGWRIHKPEEKENLLPDHLFKIEE